MGVKAPEMEQEQQVFMERLIKGNSHKTTEQLIFVFVEQEERQWNLDAYFQAALPNTRETLQILVARH